MLRSLSSALNGRVHILRRLPSLGVGTRGWNQGRVPQLSSRHPDFTVPTSVALFHSSGIRYVESQEDIDRTLLRLDQEIRKTGRVARQEIDEILQDIQDMKKATSNQVLMIIRCCGDLVPSETPESRTKLVQEVWKTMENLNVPIDISHYNALLRVYLENEYKFNPTDILQELDKKGIEPNRVTYQRLIARYCQDGDIEGASTILQHMKEKQLPINEHVFNALINGHTVAEDMESAEGMIGVMKQAGLEPNDDTYVTLMVGYARKGDLENVKRIVKECEEKEVHLIDRDFMQVIYVLAAKGHDQIVDDIIPLFRKHQGFNQDATNLILRLTNIAKLDIALRVLKEMLKIVRNDEIVPSGNFFIQQLVHRASVEDVIKYCKILEDEGLHKYALSKACDLALQTRQFDKAAQLLEVYKESGAPMRQHYFWPFFAGSKDEQDVFSGLKCMKFLEIPPTNETLRDYVIPALFRHTQGTGAERTLEKLSSYTGIPLAVLVPAAMQHLLSEKQTQQAVKYATKYRLNFSNPLLRKAIVDSFFRDQNASGFVRIIGSSSLDSEEKARETAGQMVMEVLERSKRKSQTILPILKEMLSCGVGLSNSGAELVQNCLGEELTPELTGIIEQLASADLTPKSDLYPIERRGLPAALEDKSLPELEAMYEEAKRSGKQSRAVGRALLATYCRKKNLEKAESVRQELAAGGFVFTTGVHALLLDLYSQTDQLDQARETYKSLMSGLDSPLDDIKILRYAGILAASGHFDECLDVLRNTPRDENRKPSGGLQQSAGWRILNAAADQGDVENTQTVFNVLQERNLIHVNNVTLGPLVKVHLTKDDLEGALQKFEKCVDENHAAPWKQQLFCRFIKSEDTDRLQKIIDLSTKLHGEVNTMYDLVFAFIECGKLRQAKKILETPGLRPRNDKIELTCQKYLEEDRVADLENLIQITKDLPQLDRNTMYFYLLQAYCKQNDVDKALSIWTSLQEENVQPASDLLVYLADFLRKNGKPIPFVIPEIADAPSAGKEEGSAIVAEAGPAGPRVSPLLKQFRRTLEANEIDNALQIKQRFEGSNNTERLGISDSSQLIDKLARAERLREATRLAEEMLDNGFHPYPRVMRFLLGRLAGAGELDVLLGLEKKLTDDLKRQTMFNTRLCVAYTNAGRGKEYFEKYIKGAINQLGSDSSAADIPLAGTTYLLIRHEDLQPEYEECAKKAEQHGRFALYNSIWNYHLIQKNFEKAKELWNAKMKKADRVMFRSVMVEARIKQDESIAHELASQIADSENVGNPAKGTAFACVIDVLSSKGNVEGAMNFLKQNLEKIKLEDFPRSSLIRLKQNVESSGKEFPYAIPAYQQRRTAPQGGADSDSD